MSASFRLIFRGEIATGSDRDEAARVLARRFKLDAAMTARVMSARKVALAQDLSENEAFSLQAELESAGIITRIETDPNAIPAATDPKPEPPAAAIPASPPPLQAEASQKAQETPDAFAPLAATADTTSPCRQCMRELAPGSSFCPWCGARQGSRLARSLTISITLLLMLAAIGVPLFYGASEAIQSRNASQQHVAAAMERAQDIQQQITDFIERTNFWPNSNLDAGMPRPEALADDTLQRVSIGNQAIISLTFHDDLPGIGGHTLLFVPASDSGELPRWECRGGSLPANWLPDECEPPEQDNGTSAAPSAAPAQATAAPADSAGLPPANYVRRVLTQEFEQSKYIRDKMTAYYRRHGRWPARHEALELGDPLKLGSYAMRRVQVNPGGELLFEFSTALENMEGRQLTLQALADGRKWQCQSDLPVTHLPMLCQP